MITIVIAAYNVNAYIEQCIDSLLPLKGVEIFLIDDGSPEDLTPVKEKYSVHPQFHYYKKENGGLSDARNYGLERAKTEYIMFLDGDDFVDTKAMARAIDKIEATKETAYYMTYGDYYADSGVIRPEKKRNYTLGEFISVDDERFRRKPYVMVAWRYIVKREHLLGNNLFFKKGIYHEDEEWTPRLLTSVDRVYALHEQIIFYRQREGSIMASVKYKNVTDLFLIMESLLAYKETLSAPQAIRFIDDRIQDLYRAAIYKMCYVDLTADEEQELLQTLEQYRKRISFDTRWKHRICKYCPASFVLRLQRMREGKR